MAYLLDSNVFIQAKNLYYGMDFCPAFWEWLINANQAGSVLSIQKVRDELLAGDDELADWARRRGEEFFLPLGEDTFAALSQTAEWMRGRYQPGAIASFLQDADYYLVAYALAHGHDVVTHEIPSDSTKRVKIPTVCIGMNLRYMSPFEMLRRLRARFVLGNTG